MIWRYISCCGSAGFVWILFISCVQSEYTRLVKAELAKDIRNDSLLLGIRFGDTQKDFLEKCKSLNQNHLVTDGPGDGSVRYVVIDSMYHTKPIKINFLFKPKYDSIKKISAMIFEVNYAGWAPWNVSLQSDSLQFKTMDILRYWYSGNDFIYLNVGNKAMHVKVDGNRQILVYIKDSQSVIAEVQDITNPMFSLFSTPNDKKTIQ